METTKKFHSGPACVYRGVRYNTDGSHDGLVTLFDVGTGRAVTTVPIAVLDEWFTVRTVGTFIGEPFQLSMEIDHTDYYMSYLGGNGSAIAAEWRARGDDSRFWQEDRYTYFARVPIADVQDVHEEREDILTAWRADNP